MNKVVHFEIPADDLERAKKFYGQVFGWKLEDMPEMKYVMAYTTEIDEKRMPKVAGAINGGMYRREKPEERPVIVIDVPSLSDYLKKIEEAGGKVVMETQKVGDMGLYSRVADTEGNIIGVWETLRK